MSRIIAAVSTTWCQWSVLTRVEPTVSAIRCQRSVLSRVEATVTAWVEGLVATIGRRSEWTVWILGTVPIIAWSPVGSIGLPLIANLDQVTVLTWVEAPVASIVRIAGVVSRTTSLSTRIISSLTGVEATVAQLTRVEATIATRIKATVATSNASNDGVLWEVVLTCS